MSKARELMPLAIEAVDQAAELLRTSRPGALTSKGDRDMASELDYLIERQVREQLEVKAPGIGFLGEEDGLTGVSDPCWVLDPIDGTANFVKGIPLCGISLALLERGRPVLGVVALPFLGSRFTAIDGAGAHEGTRRLRASSTSNLSEAIVAIGDYAVGPDAEQKNATRLRLTEVLASQVQRVRMLGTAALDLVWVADGKLDASITLENNPWDMAAGSLIAAEAGASILDRNGRRHSLTSGEIVAVCPALATDLLALIDGVATGSAS